jgi:death on curing protein
VTRSAHTCIHLTVAQVRAIHARAIADFGGAAGERDANLLESAVFAAQASYAGASVFEDTVDVAAAYLFYLCRNHPFVDGNKRAALGACLVFLKLNGLRAAADGPPWAALVFGVAKGELDRVATTRWLRALVT